MWMAIPVKSTSIRLANWWSGCASDQGAARPLLPRPKTSTRPRWCGACLRFAMSSREAMDYATAMRVSAKYSEKPVAASTPEMIQKRTTTFVSLQPFFSKWWCNGAMRKMRFFVFL